MKKSDFEQLKAEIQVNKEKAADLDVIVSRLGAFPCGQLKEMLTEDGINILRKYGYTE